MDAADCRSVNVKTAADLRKCRPDLLIDCSASIGELPPADRVLVPYFECRSGELGAVGAILDGREIEISIFDSRVPGIAVCARPAVANKRCLTDSLDNILSRAVELIVALARQTRANAPFDGVDTGARRTEPKIGARMSPTTASAAYGHLAQVVAGKLKRKLSRTVQQRERWALALRRRTGRDLIDGAWPSDARYTLLADDGCRFYADPTLFERNGRTWLFCEEFPFATERGVISVAEIESDGTVGRLVPVLERPYHLSYPFVFEDDGEIWMIPESGESRAVELYRATEFPFKWELDHKLIDDVPGCDATLVRRDGIYTLFLTTPHRMSTSWDNLRIYQSASLSSSFYPHATGLVTIDARQSRSAGAFIERGSDLLRPTQDCSDMYGGRIVLSRVDRLSPEAYAQTEVAEIVVSGCRELTGTHTYTRSRSFEAVDVWGTMDGIGEATLALRKVPERRLSRVQSEGVHAD